APQAVSREARHLASLRRQRFRIQPEEPTRIRELAPQAVSREARHLASLRRQRFRSQPEEPPRIRELAPQAVSREARHLASLRRQRFRSQPEEPTFLANSSRRPPRSANCDVDCDITLFVRTRGVVKSAETE